MKKATSVLQKCLLLFFFCVPDHVFVSSVDIEKVKFEIEKFDDIVSELREYDDDDATWQDNYFYSEFDLNGRKDLCRAAIRKAEFENLGQTEHNIHFRMFVKGTMIRLLMECNSVPVAYLHWVPNSNKESEDKFIIMTENNRFLTSGQKFEGRYVVSKPVSCTDILLTDSKNLDLRNDQFEELVKFRCQKDVTVDRSLLHELKENRLHFCHAAQKRNVLRTPNFLTKTVPKPQLYRFKYTDDPGKEVERVAIECPTSPRMYLHYKNVRENEDVQVLFLRSDI